MGPAGPFGEEMAVDEVKPLRLRELRGVGGDTAVGQHDHDITVVDLPASAVQDLKVRAPDGLARPAVLPVLALDDPSLHFTLTGYGDP
ncbi:hypothetical protein Sspor_81010 [Streptomyces spororaveus]|nr:hypothetical protein Sspor_81010 [Streptomyces spororaveus]